MKSKIYLNLTNGIEFLDKFGDFYKNHEYRFVRIQSSWCEQKHWEYIIADLDYDFLLHLALGFNCIVVDFSQKRDYPRAVFQGIEWIRFVLNKVWFRNTNQALVRVRRNDVTKYFEKQYDKLSRKTKNKIKYFRKFLLTNKIKLKIIAGRTKNDGNYDFYKQVLKENLPRK